MICCEVFSQSRQKALLYFTSKQTSISYGLFKIFKINFSLSRLKGQKINFGQNTNEYKRNIVEFEFIHTDS